MTEQKTYPEPDRSWWGRARDNIAYHIATFAFTHIATGWYSAMIEGSIRLGLDAARNEARAAAPTVSTEWLLRHLRRGEDDE